ncbi:ABC transporter substrate-binding protein [Streptomyces sp. INA 01156]
MIYADRLGRLLDGGGQGDRPRPRRGVPAGLGRRRSRIATALRSAGYEGLITGISSMVTPGVLKILGPDAGNIVLTSRGHAASDTSNAEIAAFNKAMKAADPKVNIDDIGLNGWLAVKLFAAVAKGQEITDGASVIKALDAIEEPVGLGDAYPDYRASRTPSAAGVPAGRLVRGRHQCREGRPDRTGRRLLRPVRPVAVCRRGPTTGRLSPASLCRKVHSWQQPAGSSWSGRGCRPRRRPGGGPGRSRGDPPRNGRAGRWRHRPAGGVVYAADTRPRRPAASRTRSTSSSTTT